MPYINSDIKHSLVTLNAIINSDLSSKYKIEVTWIDMGNDIISLSIGNVEFDIYYSELLVYIYHNESDHRYANLNELIYILKDLVAKYDNEHNS